MAKKKSRKGKSGKSAARRRPTYVELAPTVEFLHREIAESLCEEVFQEARTTERQRKWSLFALARFWISVILVAPRSLSLLLDKKRDPDHVGLLPQVDSSAEAFFQRCKTLSSRFFMTLHSRFVERVRERAPVQYCQELQYLLKRFSNVVAIDGSRLDKIAHRLKILHGEKAVILPGCLLAVYDLFRGIADQLWFEANAGASEFSRALLAVDALAKDTLVLGDRLYCSPQLFHRLGMNGCYGLFKRNKTVSIRKIRRLSRKKTDRGLLEDWIVEAGKGRIAIELRLIVLKRDGKTYEALTNVLDPDRLSVKDAAALYPERWKIERLFYDIKAVLNVKKLYAANPNAVAMQVYAATMVHTAFRIAQADIARTIGLPPEELSPEKLFPHLALTSVKLIEAEYIFEKVQEANPRTGLNKPSWNDLPDTVVSVKRIRVEHRSDKRGNKEYHKDRAKWKSITKVDGAEELT